MDICLTAWRRFWLPTFFQGAFPAPHQRERRGWRLSKAPAWMRASKTLRFTLPGYALQDVPEAEEAAEPRASRMS